MNWLVILTGMARIFFWTTGLVIAVFFPGLLGDVPYRRALVAIAFGVAAVNAVMFTIASADGHPGSVAINLTSAAGVLVAAMFLAVSVLSAWGPRRPHQ